MARVLYGVMGDARGHVMSSLAIARRLKGHEVVFVGGGCASELTRYGYSVVPVPMVGTELSDHAVDTLSTIWQGLRSLCRRSSVIGRLTDIIRDFDPDLIIADYEYFLPQAARKTGRACISVDHNHIVTHCRYDVPAGHQLGRILTAASMVTLFGAATHYLIYSFIDVAPRNHATTEVFPTVLRDELDLVRASDGDHGLVYMRGASIEWLRALLLGRKRRFIVYGFDIEREEANLSFRSYSVDGFLGDLASCNYVIANAGNTLLSEALHFHKPLLCFPVALFYEQIVNAHLLSEAGYGAHHAVDARAAGALEDFEARLPEFRGRIAAAAPVNREAIIVRLQSLIANRGAAMRFPLSV